MCVCVRIWEGLFLCGYVCARMPHLSLSVGGCKTVIAHSAECACYVCS